MVHRGILVGVVFGLLASCPGQADNLSNLLLDAIAVRFRTPPYISFPLYEGEAIRFEDVPTALAEGRNNKSLTERQCIIRAVYAFNAATFDDALYYLDRTLAQSGERTAIALELRGYCYEVQKDWPAAAKAWHDLASEENPEGKWSVREAFIHLRMNHVQQARRILLVDDAVPKGHGRRNFILGYCLLKMGETAESRRHFLQAARSYEDPEVMAFLGLVSEPDNVDDIGESLGWYKKAMTQLPPHEAIDILCHPYMTAWYEHQAFQSLMEKIDLPITKEEALAELPKARAAQEYDAYIKRGQIDISFVMRSLADEVNIIRYMSESGHQAVPIRMATGRYEAPKSQYLVQLYPGFNPWPKLWARIQRP